MNVVILKGNLTKDPESKQLGQGNDTVTSFTIAVTEKYKGRDGVAKDNTSFVGITAWGRLGENCQKYLTKGAPALIQGKLKQDTWEKDGKKQSKTFVVATSVEFIGARTRPQDPEPPKKEDKRQEGSEDDPNLPF